MYYTRELRDGLEKIWMYHNKEDKGGNYCKWHHNNLIEVNSKQHPGDSSVSISLYLDTHHINVNLSGEVWDVEKSNRLLNEKKQ